MKILKKSKDGGPKSPVDAYFLVEIKSLFSIALLKFNPGTRVSFHNHAFNALTWFLWGDMKEVNTDGSFYKYHRTLIPKFTPRNQMHKVVTKITGWCFTIRGPWSDYWEEYNPNNKVTTTFRHGRKVIKEIINENKT